MHACKEMLSKEQTHMSIAYECDSEQIDEYRGCFFLRGPALI